MYVYRLVQAAFPSHFQEDVWAHRRATQEAGGKCLYRSFAICTAQGISFGRSNQGGL